MSISMRAGLKKRSLIKGVPDALRESINEHIKAAGEKFRDVIRPIYGGTDKGTAIHVGSCILLNRNNIKFLLTAAHVVDENEHTTLYAAGEGTLVPLVEKFVVTQKVAGSRAKDHFDFAIARLSSSTLDKLGQVKYVDARDVSGARAESSGHVFMAMGCPHSKNKKIDNLDMHIRSTVWRYAATAVTDPKLAATLSITGSEHVFIKFNKKYSRDENGIRVNSINPQGMSGGGLFDLGNLADPWSLEKTAERKARLTGMLIELPAGRDLMVATRIHPILKFAQ